MGKTRAALFSCALLAACAARETPECGTQQTSPSRASARGPWYGRLEDPSHPPVPDAENAYVPLAEAHRWYEAHDGDALAGEIERIETVERTGEPLTPDDRAALRACIEQLQPCFALLDEAATRPKWAAPPIDWSKGPRARIEGLPVVARAYLLAMLRVRHTADTDRAVRLARRYARLWKRVDVPLIWGWQVSRLPLDWIVRDRHDRADFDAAALLRTAGDELLASVPARGPPPRVFAQEGALAARVVARLDAGDPVGFPNLLDDDVTFVQPGDADEFRAVGRLLRDAHAASDTTPREAIRVAATWDERIEAFEHPTARFWAERAGGIFRGYGRDVAAVRLAYVYLHLRVFRDAHGHWPPTLPRGMPLDPFTGRPFAYDGEHLYARRPGEPGPDEDGFRYVVENGLGWDLE